MKISTLSFRTHKVAVEEGGEMVNYLAFLFYINGEMITTDDDDQNPANAYDLLDESAERDGLVVLYHCGCGCWECSALIAHVDETQDGLTEWTIDRLYEYNPQKYWFRKDEYERIMTDLHHAAENEFARLKAERKANDVD